MKDRLYAAIHASLEMLANLRRQDLEAKPGVVLCSDCLYDRGLKDGAMRHGTVSDDACPNCGSIAGHKLDRLALNSLVYEFFAVGTIHRCEYGAAPQLAFNEVQTTSINFPQWLASDLKLIEKSLGIGFFYYGPRLWMIGEVEPLKALQDEATRNSIVTRILSEYPKAKISAKETFYRLRKDPSKLADFGEYDSAPTARAGAGRLDSSGFPVMYGSQDLQICVHECRVTAEDNMFVATLAAKRDLKLLDLTALIPEEETEFESLDMAIHM